MPRKPSPETLRTLILRLSLEQKQELYDWLCEVIAPERNAATEVVPPHSDATVTEQRHYEGKLYQLERRRCGKQSCKCMTGQVAEVGHGPYWYAYWREGDKVQSQYVGKRSPWMRE